MAAEIVGYCIRARRIRLVFAFSDYKKRRHTLSQVTNEGLSTLFEALANTDAAPMSLACRAQRMQDYGRHSAFEFEQRDRFACTVASQYSLQNAHFAAIRPNTDE